MNGFLAFFLGVAHAGFLQIVGEPHLSLKKHGTDLQIIGDYQIQNKGDEVARAVYPEINLDNFTFSGDPENLEAGEKKTWKISEIISHDKLIYPPQGRFAVVIYNHYQDMNGYPFGVPAIDSISLDELAVSQMPDLKLEIKSLEANQYEGRIHLSNPSASLRKFFPLYVLPREVQLSVPEAPLEVPPQGNLETSFYFLNRKGLTGSTYQAFSVLTWIEQGQRQVLFAHGGFKVEKAQTARQIWSLEKTFWAWSVWFLILGLIGMWAFWIRPLRRFQK
jgi:hypothetical protein